MEMKPLNECVAYLGGTFDLVHQGHINLFKNCKETFAKVVVSLNRDEFNERYKKTRPVMSLDQRIAVISAIKYVDQVIINEGDEDSKIAIAKVRPDIIVHGDDWSELDLMRQMGLSVNFMVENGIRFFFPPYTTGVSTTELREVAAKFVGTAVINPFEIVVARNNEDVSWIQYIKAPILLFTKNDIQEQPSHVKVIKIPYEDIGREARTYLKWNIIDRYEELAHYTLFLQGRINDHLSQPLFSYLDFVNPFSWIYDKLLETSKDGAPHNFPEVAPIYTRIFQVPPPELFRFSWGGMFMVSRKAVHTQPKSYYERILTIYENEATSRPWFSHPERYWDKIFINRHLL